MNYKFLILPIFALLSLKINGMEKEFKLDKSELWQQLPHELKTHIFGFAAWHALSIELKEEIISCLAQARTPEQLIRSMQNIICTNKELNKLAQDAIIEFTKNYIEKNKFQADTDLLKAIKRQQISVVKALLKAGINVDTKYGDNATALMLAISYSNKEIIEMLIEAGANVNAKDNLGNTPLMLAASKGSNNIVNLLLDNKANVNVKTNGGYTALTFAAANGHIEVVKDLISKGANCNILDNDRYTPLMRAKRNDHHQIVQMLRGAGAKE